MVFSKENKVLMVLRAILVIAAFAAVLMGCQNESVLIDEQSVQQGYTIDFASGFVDNRVKTKAGSVNLEQYNTTMGVWGWRSDSEITDELTFNNQLVEFVASKWSYNPPKYWVNKSSYRFYAYSPYSENVKIDPASGYIRINGIKDDGTDWMIARSGQRIGYAAAGHTVEFTMQHILSNIQVRACVTDAILNDPMVEKVVIDNMTIGQFANSADFQQKFDYTPSASEYAQEWSVSPKADMISFNYNKADSIGGTNITLIDALAIPQVMNQNMVLTLTYVMYFTDGHTERFLFSDSLIDIFEKVVDKQFICGNSYTISLRIGSESITFDAGSEEWTDIE